VLYEKGKNSGASLVRLIDHVPQGNPQWSGATPDPGSSAAPWRIYNIGNNKPEELTRVVAILEQELGNKAERQLLPMQPGDVPATYADIDEPANRFPPRHSHRGWHPSICGVVSKLS